MVVPCRPSTARRVRLIAPGWYGVANVKWLTRIEVIDRRFTGRFMARDYVTIREQTLESGETVWTFTNVGQARPKSAPARVSRHGNRYSVFGVAWGAPVARVEVSIDGGPWTKAQRCDQKSQGAVGKGNRLAVLDVRLGDPGPRHPHSDVARIRHRRQPSTST